MKFYLYILYDKNRDKYYIGQTANLEDRIKRHINRRNKYTKSGNWQLVYKEVYTTRSKAVLREPGYLLNTPNLIDTSNYLQN